MTYDKPGMSDHAVFRCIIPATRAQYSADEFR
jgi:hypothetical protein